MKDYIIYTNLVSATLCVFVSIMQLGLQYRISKQNKMFDKLLNSLKRVDE